MPTDRASVVIIGAGVVGLSCALRILDAGYAVTVVARDLPHPAETADPIASINYASLWAGAHNRWIPPPPPPDPSAVLAERDHGLALITFDHMVETARDPSAGITLVPGIEYVESPSAAYTSLGENDCARARELNMCGFRLLDQAELPAGVAWGCRYDSWCLNPMVYCAYLLRRIVNGGAKVRRAQLEDLREAWALPGCDDAAVVVNCSGTGFGDRDMVISRGQTCLVAESCSATITRLNADGTREFCIPRGCHGGTVIGGTEEPANWSREPSAADRDELLAKFAAGVDPAMAARGLTVVTDIVGRRPRRNGGARLERETLGGDDGGPKREVVHAYGLGGRGFEMSWGVASTVAKLVGEAVGCGGQIVMA